MPESKESHWLVSLRTADDHLIAAKTGYASEPIDAIIYALREIQTQPGFRERMKNCTQILAEWIR